MIEELVARTRTYRKFKQDAAVSQETLEYLVDIGRQCPSGGNLQPLVYALSCDPETNARIYPHLRWAGYLTDWDGPEEGERPAAYIVILRDNDVTTNFMIDHGIAVQAMRLAATEEGLGSCIVGSLDRDALRADLKIPTRYEILIALALGQPAETVRIEGCEDGDIRYWRDDEAVLHVPKRPLKDLLLKLP